MHMRSGEKVKWPAVLAELYDITSDGLKNAGYKQEDCQSISGIVIKALSAMGGGKQFYMPVSGSWERSVRDTQLFQDFTGTNIEDLVRKYGISLQLVYSIIRKQRDINRFGGDAILQRKDNLSGTTCVPPEAAQRADVQNRDGE